MKKPKISVSMKGNQNKKGFKYSDEQKFKIKQQKIANGFKGPTYGKKFNENTKLLMREKAIKNGIKPPVGFGKDSAHWKGGGINWVKRQVLIRDNYTCQKCGLRDDDIMCVDHIKPRSIYPELDKEMTNLQTLCPNCHARSRK